MVILPKRPSSTAFFKILLATLDGDFEWFFDDHVLPSLGGQHGGVAMSTAGGADRNRLNLGIG